jgi:hypothetical protein
MKRNSFLSVLIFTVMILGTTIYSESHAQTSAKAKKTIETSSKNFLRWFNAGKVDSLMTLYTDNACLVGQGCGKEFIQGYYTGETGKYKFKELTVNSVQVNETNAIEKGEWKISFSSGQEIGGEYSTEWKLINNKWLIFKDQVTIK